MADEVVVPRVGDVIGVPAARGGFHFAVVVARNRFGTALGLLAGRRPSWDGSERPRPARRLPIYTHDNLIVDGTWPIVGHDEKMLPLFPADPEIYHSPRWQWPGIDLGEFGLAETAGGKTRLLTKEEAEEVGLSDGRYQQLHGSDLVPDYLESLDDPEP